MANADADLIELVVACRSWQEAQHITDALFERQMAKTIETIESTTSSMRRHATGHTHSVKLIVQVARLDVARVQQLIRASRRQIRHPHVAFPETVPSLVTRWLHKATEVKSGRLKR